MKRLNVFFLLLFNLLSIYAQQIKSYKDECGFEIIIKDSLFYYIENHHPSCPIWYNDTLAKCTIKRINDEFMELNSPYPYQQLLSGYNILKQTVENVGKDSIKICFQMPYDRGPLSISISLRDFYYPFKWKNYDWEFSQSNSPIILPKTFESFSYSISPVQRNQVIHEVLGINYGILFIQDNDILVEKDVNYIQINIPSLTNSFFEKYYVNKEYVRIIGDTIIWKGRTFINR
jgi:hypothetical protein